MFKSSFYGFEAGLAFIDNLVNFYSWVPEFFGKVPISYFVFHVFIGPIQKNSRVVFWVFLETYVKIFEYLGHHTQLNPENSEPKT